MDEKYRVFPEKYNKMLDLIEIVDEDLVIKYKKFISKLPVQVIEKMMFEKEFCFQAEDLRIEQDSYGEMMEFQCTTYRKFFNISLNIYPYYEDELLEEYDDEFEILDPEIAEDENEYIFIFSLTLTDCKDEPKVKINFEEVDGKYEYKETKIEGKEVEYSVFVERREDDEFFLISKCKFNGIEIKKKEKPISYDELVKYANYDEEDEINAEFDGLEEEYKFYSEEEIDETDYCEEAENEDFGLGID